MRPYALAVALTITGSLPSAAAAEQEDTPLHVTYANAISIRSRCSRAHSSR